MTFADQPWRYVFWRGTRNLPSLVTAHGAGGIWSNDQGPERYEKQCYVHMSDMLCRYSKLRIIHRSDARAMVHWRNASASIAYRWPALDTNGWGIWTDEYWTIYPDGISIRHQLVHNNTDKGISAELNQNEMLCHPPRRAADPPGDDDHGRVHGRERVAGTAGCNRYFGSAKPEAGRISMGPFGATRMACSPDEVMTQESRYLAALQAARSYTIRGDELWLGPTASETTLVFTSR